MNNDGIIAFFLTSIQFDVIFFKSQSILLTFTILQIYTLIVCSNHRLNSRLYFTQNVFAYHCLHPEQKTKWRTYAAYSCDLPLVFSLCPCMKFIMILILVVLSLHSYNLRLHCIIDYLSGQY